MTSLALFYFLGFPVLIAVLTAGLTTWAVRRAVSDRLGRVEALLAEMQPGEVEDGSGTPELLTSTDPHAQYRRP